MPSQSEFSRSPPGWPSCWLGALIGLALPEPVDRLGSRHSIQVVESHSASPAVAARLQSPSVIRRNPLHWRPRMHFLPALVLVTVAAVQPSPPLQRSESLLVRRVIDGDTIDVAGIGRVRLLGIAAPKAGRRVDATPIGREASARLASLVLHRYVRLELEISRSGGYRRLAYVMREDGLFVNEVLVREGLARVNARGPLARLTSLQAAEREARAMRRGMWGRVTGSSGSPTTGSADRTGKLFAPPQDVLNASRFVAAAMVGSCIGLSWVTCRSRRQPHRIEQGAARDPRAGHRLDEVRYQIGKPQGGAPWSGRPSSGTGGDVRLRRY